jgi:hypothetical protein
MSPTGMKISRSLRIAGLLLLLGLLTEAISLHWSHPLAFIVFVCLGGVFLCAGVLLYLYSLVSSAPASN